MNEKISLSLLGFPKYSIDVYGNVYNDKNKLLTHTPDKRGYSTVSLIDNYGIRRTKVIHRLVAKLFIPNYDNKPQVNHLDGNKINNDWNNLEWVTNLENSKHARENGLMPHNLLSEQDAHLICNLLNKVKHQQKSNLLLIFHILLFIKLDVVKIGHIFLKIIIFHL